MIIGEFTETYPPMLDGVGRVTMAYCQTLEAAGHTAYYIAPDDRDHSRFDGLRTILYGGVAIPGQNYRLGMPALSASFKKQIREIPFDILHIHSPFISAGIARHIVEARPEVPVVATFHSKYYDDFLKITHSRKVARGVTNYIVRTYNACDAVWSLNAETAEVLHGYGYTGEIRIVPNGTDIPEPDPGKAAETRLRLGIAEGTPVLLFIGQMDMKKNIHSVLRACALLKKEGMNFMLLLAGRGPDQSRLEKMREELDLTDRSLFLGFVSDGELLRGLYSLADLFVFPSVYDNAPMVVREAAANGTPSLLVRGSCAAEGVTDGDNGFLCDNSPEDIARGIREALPRCREAGERARETIPKPWKAIIDSVMEEYRLLIESRKRKVGRA